MGQIINIEEGDIVQVKKRINLDKMQYEFVPRCNITHALFQMR